MSFAEPISADFSVREFATRGTVNPDGWGLAWYPDGGRAVAVVKEPVQWSTTLADGLLAGHPTLSSRIYLAHVREKTVGGAPNHADTHPFTRELAGLDFVFAHNGTLTGPAWELPLGPYHPVGATDSERFFCHLMAEVARRGPATLGTAEGWNWLHELLSRTNDLGKLNVLFADGERLFVYHDRNGWKGLSFRQLRLREGYPRHFGDNEIQVELESEHDGRPNAGYVVATYPLSAGGWRQFERGELIVFERGKIVFSSQTEPARLVP